MQTYYSIAELLDLKLQGYPTTRRGWEKYVQANELKYREVPSRGKGGVRKEYELSDDLKSKVVLKDIKNEIVSVPNSAEQKTVVVNAAELLNWQREIAENRLFIVRFIQQQVKSGVRITRAVEQFIEDAANQTLASDMQDAVRKANAKAGEERTVSRRSVFDWIKQVGEAEQRGISVISQAPDPAKYVPIAVVTQLQTELATLQGATQTNEIQGLIAAACSDGRLRGEGMKAWAAELGNTNPQALKDYLAAAPKIQALGGKQTDHAAANSQNNAGRQYTAEELHVAGLLGVTLGEKP